MATRIKLTVNHGKHAKQESGQKIIPKQENNSESIKATQDNKKTSSDENKKIANPNNKEANKIQALKNQATKGKQQKMPKQLNKQTSDKQSKEQAQQKKQDKQLQTIERVKQTQLKTKLTIEQLLYQYRHAADDIFTNHGHNQEKEKIIANKLNELQRQKQQRRRKLGILEEHSKQKQARKQGQEKQKIQNKLQKKLQKRRRRAQSKIQSLRALSQQRLQNEQKYKQYYDNEYKNKKPRFVRYQEQFEELQQRQQQEYEQKLSKHKAKFSPMNSAELEAFMDEYEHRRWDMIEEIERKREQNLQEIEEHSREYKSKLWKGECHKRVRQEIREKMEIRSEPRTKLEKTKNYGTIVKDEFKPKINQEYRNKSLSISMALKNEDPEDIQDQNGKVYKRVARQKYHQGVNQGLVIQNQRKSLEHAEKVKRGNQYLEFLRSLPKIKKQPTQTLEPSPALSLALKKTPSTTFKLSKPRNPYYKSSLTERLPSKSVAIEERKLKDPEMFNKIMASMKSQQQQMLLQEKAIKYGKYRGILDLQDRHNTLNKKIIDGISEKLQMLSRI